MEIVVSPPTPNEGSSPPPPWLGAPTATPTTPDATTPHARTQPTSQARPRTRPQSRTTAAEAMSVTLAATTTRRPQPYFRPAKSKLIASCRAELLRFATD